MKSSSPGTLRRAGELRAWCSEVFVQWVARANGMHAKGERQSVVDEVADGRVGLHLAVFTEPHATMLRRGTKLLESRFSRMRTTPYRRVMPGDVVVAKLSSIEALVFEVGDVHYYWFGTGECRRIDAKSYEKTVSTNGASLQAVSKRHAEGIAAPTSFWTELAGRHPQFASVFEIVPGARDVVQVTPCPKSDRRGWVVVQASKLLTMVQD